MSTLSTIPEKEGSSPLNQTELTLSTVASDQQSDAELFTARMAVVLNVVGEDFGKVVGDIRAMAVAAGEAGIPTGATRRVYDYFLTHHPELLFYLSDVDTDAISVKQWNSLADHSFILFLWKMSANSLVLKNRSYVRGQFEYNDGVAPYFWHPLVEVIYGLEEDNYRVLLPQLVAEQFPQWPEEDQAYFVTLAMGLVRAFLVHHDTFEEGEKEGLPMTIERLLKHRDIIRKNWLPEAKVVGTATLLLTEEEKGDLSELVSPDARGDLMDALKGLYAKAQNDTYLAGFMPAWESLNETDIFDWWILNTLRFQGSLTTQLTNTISCIAHTLPEEPDQRHDIAMLACGWALLVAELTDRKFSVNIGRQLDRLAQTDPSLPYDFFARQRALTIGLVETSRYVDMIEALTLSAQELHMEAPIAPTIANLLALLRVNMAKTAINDSEWEQLSAEKKIELSPLRDGITMERLLAYRRIVGKLFVPEIVTAYRAHFNATTQTKLQAAFGRDESLLVVLADPNLSFIHPKAPVV